MVPENSSVWQIPVLYDSLWSILMQVDWSAGGSKKWGESLPGQLEGLHMVVGICAACYTLNRFAIPGIFRE